MSNGASAIAFCISSRLSSKSRSGLIRARAAVASSNVRVEMNFTKSMRCAARDCASPNEVISRRYLLSPIALNPASAIAITSASIAGSSKPIASIPT